MCLTVEKINFKIICVNLNHIYTVSPNSTLYCVHYVIMFSNLIQYLKPSCRSEERATPPNHRQLSVGQTAALLPLYDQITVIPQVTPPLQKLHSGL